VAEGAVLLRISMTTIGMKIPKISGGAEIANGLVAQNRSTLSANAKRTGNHSLIFYQTLGYEKLVDFGVTPNGNDFVIGSMRCKTGNNFA
jgi:hypothetical protein